ncbi:hypothetical protein FACS189450_14040 [Spirochaetia bacterium]|nr:hypothetical protein FACS189450_14040 [Spirochaetia bacterium]
MNIFLLKNDINQKKLKHNIVYIKNAFVLFFDNILKFIIGFVMSILVARYLGPGRFGQINYVAAFVSILQMFVLFGFDDMLIKDMGLGIYRDQIISGTNQGFW